VNVFAVQRERWFSRLQS